jgi:hypothetical protein
MTVQRAIADAILSNNRRTTRRAQFLTEMNWVMPWATVEASMAPHYPKARRGRRPLPMATMLRLYFLQQRFITRLDDRSTRCWHLVGIRAIAPPPM